MRILQLVPQFPFPMTDGGKIGIGNITRYFALRGHEVQLFAVSAMAVSPERVQEAAQWCTGVHVVEQAIANSPRNIARSLFSSTPLYVWKFAQPNVFSALDRLCQREQFDCIHADHSSMIPLALRAKRALGVPAGLRIHNVEWLIWQRYAERFAAWHPAQWYLQQQAARLRAYEARFYPAFEVCFPITDDDAQRARAMAPTGVYTTAPAGVNTDEWCADSSVECVPTEVVLATTYEWVHNVEGAVWLIENVLPLVQQHCPQVHLTLLGKNPPEKLTSLQRRDVAVTGFVERVQPYMSKAGVYVAPLFVGGGIRIKILEAMAMELPVVATSVAAEGIHATESDGVFRADTAQDFARCLAALVQQPERARELGKRARLCVERFYTWERNVGIMATAYEHCIRG